MRIPSGDRVRLEADGDLTLTVVGLKSPAARICVPATVPARAAFCHNPGMPLLDALGLSGQVRAEAMNVEELLALAEALRSRLGGAAS